MKNLSRYLLFWVLLLGVAYFVFNMYNVTEDKPVEITYSDFISEVRLGRIDSVVFKGDGVRIYGTRSDGSAFTAVRPVYVSDPDLIVNLVDHGVRIIAEKPEEASILSRLLVASFPVLLLLILAALFMRYSQGGSSGSGWRNNPLNFGRSRAKMMQGGKVDITFADVAGCEEAKEEVSELVEFLRDPTRFDNLGGRIPKGVLMVGPPGTGKTLLAKAVAGEAQVPFFSISGSDFVEMFVGVGASRVRDMFERARANSPCIVFIDEIDAVGRHRGAGVGGGHDEREQTLNQLLVEMDGFDASETVIIIAATNRPDVLDPALLRPGRFDRQVVVNLPDVRGREQILKVHSRKIKLHEDVNLGVIARGTPGFSGADLANLVNEAALMAARNKGARVQMRWFEGAKDRILMGAERRSMAMTDEEKQLTAYHESGHAIVGRLCEGHDPVYKVSIIPRGRALGVTMFLPERDANNHSRRQLISRITSLYGGRVAEELIYGEESVTTGASNDIQRATELARNMVTRWGLSDLGPLEYQHGDDQVFLGRSAASGGSQQSDAQAAAVDAEIRKIAEGCYASARELLDQNRDKLEIMTEALMQYETLDSDQIDDVMAGVPVRSPPEPDPIFKVFGEAQGQSREPGEEGAGDRDDSGSDTREEPPPQSGEPAS